VVFFQCSWESALAVALPTPGTSHSPGLVRTACFYLTGGWKVGLELPKIRMSSSVVPRMVYDHSVKKSTLKTHVRLTQRSGR
jgi:hypothetical protein